jgi:hypothetical protein
MNHARIRLEGQLELVEESLAALEQGAALLEQDDVVGVVAVARAAYAPRTLRAEQAVRRMADDEASLEGVVKALEVARRHFGARLNRRVKMLGRGFLPLEAAAQLVEAMPVSSSRVGVTTTPACLCVGETFLRFDEIVCVKVTQWGWRADVRVQTVASGTHDWRLPRFPAELAMVIGKSCRLDLCVGW